MPQWRLHLPASFNPGCEENSLLQTDFVHQTGPESKTGMPKHARLELDDQRSE
jgi:hypothetical protein